MFSTNVNIVTACLHQSPGGFSLLLRHGHSSSGPGTKQQRRRGPHLEQVERNGQFISALGAIWLNISSQRKLHGLFPLLAVRILGIRGCLCVCVCVCVCMCVCWLLGIRYIIPSDSYNVLPSCPFMEHDTLFSSVDVAYIPPCTVYGWHEGSARLLYNASSRWLLPTGMCHPPAHPTVCTTHVHSNIYLKSVSLRLSPHPYIHPSTHPHIRLSIRQIHLSTH